MLLDARHKLIWYPAGNRVQLFDLQDDPEERHDRAQAPEYAPVRARLTEALCARLWGIDREQGWMQDGRLVGPARPAFPRPPQLAADQMVGFPQ